MLLGSENVGIAVGIVLLIYLQAEMYVFHTHFRLQADIYDFSLTVYDVGQCMLIFVQSYFSTQRNMRITFKFHIYFMCNIRYKYFRFHVRHFDFRLKADRIVHRAMLQRCPWHPQKQTQQCWIFSYRRFTPFDSMVTKLNYQFFFQEITPPFVFMRIRRS